MSADNLTETKPRRNALTMTIVILTILVPSAECIWTRIYAGAPAVDPFGMPWPEPFWHGLQYVAAGIVALTFVLAIVGLTRKGSSRAAGIAALVVIAVFLVFMLALNGVFYQLSNPGL